MSSRIHIQTLESRPDVTGTLERFADQNMLILLDSAGPIRDQDARYSFLTADPLDVVRLDQAPFGSNPLDQLRHWQDQLPDTDAAALPPFTGGIAGLLSYELGHAFESLPRPPVDSFETPALLAGLFDWAIVWDHLNNTVQFYVLRMTGDFSGGADRRQSERIGWIEEILARPDSAVVSSPDDRLASLGEADGYQLPASPDVYSCFAPREYLTAVGRVIDYIRAGDIFQANLSQQMKSTWSGNGVSLFRRVLQENPAPFCGLLQTDEFSIVSASPERFLKVTGGRSVETRPIKGTRRRHRSPIADLFTGDELQASEKDRAENVMIVDLLRNDLSRVCRAGSVRVTAVCEVEVFETVQHLVSTVIGELAPGKDVWDLCAAAVPGGSITGAPKIRAMEIIAELEPVVRGAYCGNLFYLGPAGDFDSSILIRTFTLKDGVVQFPVGGGIVADSSPRDEYEETLHKAAGMLKTLRTRQLTD